MANNSYINLDLLEYCITVKQENFTTLAEKLNTSRFYLKRKFSLARDGKNLFTLSDIQTISACLDLSDELISKIFFAKIDRNLENVPQFPNDVRKKFFPYEIISEK